MENQSALSVGSGPSTLKSKIALGAAFLGVILGAGAIGSTGLWIGSLLGVGVFGLGVAVLMGRVRSPFSKGKFGAWLMVTGALALPLSKGAHESRLQEQKKLESERVRVEEQQKAAVALEARLRSEAAPAAEQARPSIEEAVRLSTEGKYAEAITAASAARSTLLPYATLNPPIPAVQRALQQIGVVIAENEPFDSARKVIENAAAEATAFTGDDILVYRDRLTADVAALNAITPPVRERFADEIKKATRAVEAKLKSIQKRVAAAEKERAEMAALALLCGDKPLLNPWDGELVGSESYVERGAHDPDSIDVEHCTEPVLTKKACWVSKCEVRGKNAFGAKVLNQMIFSVGRDGIRGAENVR